MTGPSHGVCVTRSEAEVAPVAQVRAGRVNEASSLSVRDPLSSSRSEPWFSLDRLPHVTVDPCAAAA